MMQGYGDFAQAVAVAGGARFGQSVFGPRSVWHLGDYMNEVEAQIMKFDVFVRDLERNPKGDTCDHGFFGAWNDFVNAPEDGFDDIGRPHGWRVYYDENDGTLWQAYTDDPIWATTEAYEDELIRFYDWSIACGAKPETAMKRPEARHQPPPPGETTEGQIKDALKYAFIIGGIFAAGYLLRAVPGVRKGS